MNKVVGVLAIIAGLLGFTSLLAWLFGTGPAVFLVVGLIFVLAVCYLIAWGIFQLL